MVATADLHGKTLDCCVGGKKTCAANADSAILAFIHLSNYTPICTGWWASYLFSREEVFVLFRTTKATRGVGLERLFSSLRRHSSVALTDLSAFLTNKLQCLSSIPDCWTPIIIVIVFKYSDSTNLVKCFCSVVLTYSDHKLTERTVLRCLLSCVSSFDAPSIIYKAAKLPLDAVIIVVSP